MDSVLLVLFLLIDCECILGFLLGLYVCYLVYSMFVIVEEEENERWLVFDFFLGGMEIFVVLIGGNVGR